MRITESQLRRIIRHEIRALHESEQGVPDEAKKIIDLLRDAFMKGKSPNDIKQLMNTELEKNLPDVSPDELRTMVNQVDSKLYAKLINMNIFGNHLDF